MSNLQKYKQRITKNKAMAKNILRTTFQQLCEVAENVKRMFQIRQNFQSENKTLN